MYLHAPNLYLSNASVSGTGVRTTVARHAGDFVGFYSGEIITHDEYERQISADATIERLGFEITGTDAIVVRRSPDDLIGYINEPPLGVIANVVAIPLHLDFGNAIGYFAGSSIGPNDELLVHYGDDAMRDYPVGRCVHPPRQLQRADAVLSQAAMACTSRYCASRCKINLNIEPVNKSS